MFPPPSIAESPSCRVAPFPSDGPLRSGPPSATMTHDISDSALLALVARLDRDALSKLFHRYATVVLVAAGWTEQNATDAEQRTVHVFLDVWKRPEAYTAGDDSTRSHLIRSALGDATEPEGWTYHDVAEVLARPHRQIALIIREQLNEMRRHA